MLVGNLQETLITILATDDKNAPIIRGVVDIGLWGGPYKHIAARCYDYVDRYKKAPGQHLPDILSDKLDAKNGREANLYADIVENILTTKDGINTVYGMSRLESFIEHQALRGVAINLAKALQRDTEESLEEARTLIAGATKKSLSVFDPGTRLSNKSRVLEFLDIQQGSFPTGIAELDRRSFGPTRKEMWLLVANTKGGKSWTLMHLAKMALMHRVKVCHVTLEMSEARCAQRYMQALFAISKRQEIFNTTKFNRDDLGRIAGFEDQRVTPKLTFDDPNIRVKLERRIDRWSSRMLDNIFIKEFPTGTLTMPQLKAYLDNLETTENFIPDLLVVDYPDLFKLDKANFRLALDEVYKELRGIAVSRNLALAIVSQSHRDAARSKLVKADNVAEAYSKISHADTILTLSATEQEQKLGLARLHVAHARNDTDKITVVISQNYGMGQFVVQSVLLKGEYWNHIPRSGDGNGED